MNEDIQNRTVDKGWGSMKAMLDKEMPAHEKRRRIIWWWLALLLMPLIALGGWYWTIGAPSGKAPVEELKHSPGIPFASESPNNAENAPARSTMDMVADGVEVESMDALPPRTTFREPNKPVLPSPSKQIKRTQKISTDRVPKSTSTSSLTATIDPSSQEPGTTIQNIETNTAVPAAVPEVRAGFNMLPISAQFVPSQLTQTYPTPALVIVEPIENIIVPLEKSPTWTFGVGTNIGTERFKAVNSYGAGLTVNVSLMRRWSLRSGLHYVQFIPSQKSQPTASVNYEQYSTALNSDFEITDLLGNVLPGTGSYTGHIEDVIIPVAKMNMLEVPLLISCKLPVGLKAFGGITSSYVLNAKARNEGFSTNFKFKANTDPDARSLNELAVSNLNRWRFDFQAGLGLRLGQQWELGLFTKLPLNRLNAKAGNSVSMGGNNSFFDVNYVNVNNRLPMNFILQANYFLARN